MDGWSSAVRPKTGPCLGDVVCFSSCVKDPAVNGQLPSRARLERRASSGTYKGGRCLHETGGHKVCVCISLTCFGSGSCLRAFQIDGRSIGRSVWMKPEILLLIPSKTSSGCKSYCSRFIVSRVFMRTSWPNFQKVICLEDIFLISALASATDGIFMPTGSRH